MKNYILCLWLTAACFTTLLAQDNPIKTDSTATQNLDEVLVKAVRVKSNAPITHSNFSKKDIEKRNLGQDIPILLNYLPGVVTTSDAGAGIGYTGIRVRGSDATSCLLYTSPSPRDPTKSRMPSSA